MRSWEAPELELSSITIFLMLCARLARHRRIMHASVSSPVVVEQVVGKSLLAMQRRTQYLVG